MTDASQPFLIAAGIAFVLAATAGGFAVAALARDRRHARRKAQTTGIDLAARDAELQTLHAIGREVLSTVDLDRIFAIIERECRKVFDVEFFFIGVHDASGDELSISYRSLHEDMRRKTLRPLGDDLASWVVREKRSLRVDDAASKVEPLPFRPHVVDERIRSVLATPLLVGERVVGALSVQSRHVAAYTEHQLSVLSTVAQLAAVAVENARQHALATTDSLTRLSLREDFFRRAEEERHRAVRYTSCFTILMCDLDTFKDINDRHGHLAGDHYLRAAGAAVRDALRAADIACRYGGDEFCVLLPETDLSGGRPIAERLRQALSRLVVEFEGVPLRTTLSIGIAAYPEHDGGDIKTILLRADSALYKAKRAGRDRVVRYE